MQLRMSRLSRGFVLLVAEICSSLIGCVVFAALHGYADSLIDWISDTRPQGRTDLQSPVKCLDHR